MEPPLLGASLPLVPVPQAAPRMVTPEVTTVLNATTAGSATPLLPTGVGGGVLEIISPLSLDGTAIPRGRMYAQAWVVDSMGNRLFTVWSGYLQTAGSTPAGPASVPGIPLDPAWSIIVVVTQTGQGAATRVGFAALISPGGVARGSPGYIHSEAPGEGPGEVRTVSVAAPAAGANPAATPVPAKTTWAIRAARLRYTADANVANRVVVVRPDDGTTTVYVAAPDALLTASQDVKMSLFVGGESQVSVTAPGGGQSGEWQGALPEMLLTAGSNVNLEALNKQAGDQWAASLLAIEEWAVP